VTVRRDHGGWWMVRCPNYHPPGSSELLACELDWEDAMAIATDHCPTNLDPIGDCEPSWVTAAREFPEPEPPRFTNLPDIDHYQEQQ